MSHRYSFTVPGLDVTFEAERLRRDRQELMGELTVKCGLPGARIVNGILNTSDFNFSSLRARQDRAKLLKERAQTNGQVDWFLLLEDFCQRVFQAERSGDPAVDLRTLPRPQRDDEINVQGLTFPRRHPSILFGDGGAAKSYTALFLAGRLAQDGYSVALFDWELAAEDHRDRLERLFGDDMPPVLYCRCERPLTAEADRLRRVVRQHQIDYVIFDSIAFACDGPPEAAEIAGRYFRSVREIGCGSLHIAHISKSVDNSDRKPFGSTFWHNGARCTWYVEAVEQAGDDTNLQIGFFNRKRNLGALHSPVSYRLTFDDDQTRFERVSIVDSAELAAKMSIKQRMAHLLKRGSMTVEEIAEAIEAKPESVEKAARRDRTRFIVLSGGRVGLVGK